MESLMSPRAEWTKRIRVIRRCRICANAELEPVVDLGLQCLAGLFDDGRPENQLTTPIPLEVVHCRPNPQVGGCGFVQLRHTVPAEVMFHDYGYRSGVNTTMRRHLEAISSGIESRLDLRPGDLVVDIGANDGTSLKAYACPGIVRVGFEPSVVRPEEEDHRLLYISAFFSRQAFRREFPDQKARVVTSIAMLYDVDDPIRFCEDVHEILSEDGLWVVELSYWGAILENNGFDAICHEHLGYYSLATLQWLFQRTGFELYDVSFNASNGGSVRVFLVKQGGRSRIPEENRRRVAQALQREWKLGYDHPESLARFRRSVSKIREDLRAALEEALRSGKRIYGYGASTKGNVLLQYCGIGPRHLMAVADRNPLKVGRWTPGSRIRISSEDEMRQQKPDLLLILPWHFLEEFLQRESALRSHGTRFIVPFPEPRIV